MKYRKKPVIVGAYQTDKEVIIHTLEGDMKASAGDYIITGINGEQYPCKPDIFEKTYELAESEEEEEEKVKELDDAFDEGMIFAFHLVTEKIETITIELKDKGFEPIGFSVLSGYIEDMIGEVER